MGLEPKQLRKTTGELRSVQDGCGWQELAAKTIPQVKAKLV